METNHPWYCIHMEDGNIARVNSDPTPMFPKIYKFPDKAEIPMDHDNTAEMKSIRRGMVDKARGEGLRKSSQV